MNTIVAKLSSKIVSSEEDKAKTNKYLQMQSTEGWKTHCEWMFYIRGLMAEDLLSDRFTALKPIEKDVCQRAYAMADQLIMFLVDPLVKARKMNAVAMHNARMEATLRGATERKG